MVYSRIYKPSKGEVFNYEKAEDYLSLTKHHRLSRGTHTTFRLDSIVHRNCVGILRRGICHRTDTCRLTLDGSHARLHIGGHRTAKPLIPRIAAPGMVQNIGNLPGFLNSLHISENNTIFGCRHATDGIHTRSLMYGSKHLQQRPHSNHHAHHNNTHIADGTRH